MKPQSSASPRPWTFIASALFHAGVIGLLLWGGLQTTPPPSPAPLALELWTTAPPPPPAVTAPTAPAPAPQPAPEPKPVVEAPPAEVNLGKKDAPKHETPKPEPKPAAEPEPKKPKHEPKPAEPEKKAPEKAKPAEKAPDKKETKAHTPPAAKPGHKTAKAYNNEADDLLSSLDSSRTSGKPNARSDQAGSKHGVAGGAVNGSGVNAGWIDLVKAKVTPLVQVPPGINGNPAAMLRVTLLPTLEVKAVQLVKSSGVPAYDDAVQRAVWEAKTFPKLPAGANFNDGYRTFTLTFRPR
ncbi:cell envelope integrity protein TolA [Chromobacterium vaccinii]|uniref:cell envelope integrity protein TolA n=1 Tax=Chromobacterium vaccinii TaxID=1108595 RepID=UPI001E2B680A|nr:cell envelope integrity protein TolA [Chromobacterium vaccinii]MCD4501605.1 cell envelope integrity protein TolA [Chromobacterium vaccinii]